MISIDRDSVACPNVLEGADDDRNVFSHPEVVEALSHMQYGKCCYCERKIPNSGHSRGVEHFRPKSEDMFPELKNTWSNLLHACAACNGFKGKKFRVDGDGNPRIIDPSDPTIDPEDHLDFNTNDEEEDEFGRIKPKNNSTLGEVSIEAIGLDGIDWRRSRIVGYKDLYSAYLEIVEAMDDTTKTQKIRAFEARLCANNEHAAFARAFARRKNLDEKYGVRIPEGAHIA